MAWLKILDAGLQKMASDTRSAYEELFDEDPEMEEELLEEMVDELLYYRYEAASFPYEYFLVCCFAQFELVLGDFCERFSRIHGQPFVVEEFRGSYIERCQAFVKRVLSLPFPDNTQAWADLKAVARLRNCIVHRGGRVEGSPGERSIRALKRRVASEVPSVKREIEERDFYDRLASDEDSEVEVELARALCTEALAAWRDFVQEFAERLDDHFGFRTGYHRKG
jgi:hypothetical protein